jgi:hypothetical protein
MINPTQDDNYSVFGSLSTISHKLRGLGYLIEHNNNWESRDLEDVNAGIGAILNDLSKEVYQVAVFIDEREVKRAQKEMKISEKVDKNQSTDE